MSIPAVIMIALLTLSLGANMIMHNQPKTGKYSFWVALFNYVLYMVILWWGGFFK